MVILQCNVITVFALIIVTVTIEKMYFRYKEHDEKMSQLKIVILSILTYIFEKVPE